MLLAQGGLTAHLGTTDLAQVEKLMDQGTRRAALVFEAMAQQVAMEIAGSCPSSWESRWNGSLLTGGMAHSAAARRPARDLLHQLPIRITVLPGEDELEALRDGARRVLRGHEAPRVYEITGLWRRGRGLHAQWGVPHSP